MSTVYTKVADVTTTYEEIGDLVATDYNTDTNYDNDVQYNGVDETVYVEVADITTSITKVNDI